MRISKILLLFLATLILASPATFAITVNSHLDKINPITCKQNDTVEITAQLWAENEYFDNPICSQDLYLYLSPEYQTEIDFQSKEKTAWPTGKATFKVDTKNIKPTTNMLMIYFYGGSELFGSFRPCSTYTTFTVTT